MPACDATTPGLPADADAGDVFLAALDSLEEQRRAALPPHVLIVTPAEHVRATRLARAAAGQPGIALAQVPGPPTMLAVLDLVLSQHPHLSASDALAVVHALPGRVRTHAVVSSVAGLDRPRPGMLQHVASYFWWTRFALDAHEGTVRSVRDAASAVPPAASEPVAAASVQATLAASSSDRITLDYLAVAPQALAVDVTDATTQAWSARRYVERSFLHGASADVVSAARARPARACANCDVDLRASSCPFCGVRQHNSERAAA